MTFSTLQTLSSGIKPFTMPFEGTAGDDISVAKAIADRYESQGIDPRAAYDSPDDALGDFGGINNLI